MTTNPGYPAISPSGGAVKSLSDAASSTWVRRIVESLNNILKGKINVVLPITLSFGNASTEVIDARIGAFSGLILEPLTAHAAAAKYISPYILPASQQSGQVTFDHGTVSASDLDFNLIILG